LNSFDDMLIDKVLQGLFSDNPQFRQKNAKILATIGPQDYDRVRAGLVKALHFPHPNPDPRDKHYVMDALFHLGPAAAPDAIGPLILVVEESTTKILKEDDQKDFFNTVPDPGNYAARVLGEIGPAIAPQALEPLTRNFMARSRSSIGQIDSGEALSNAGCEGIAVLIRLLFDTSPLVRKNAALALAYAQDKCAGQVAETLCSLIVSSPDSLERLRAVEALGRIGGKVGAEPRVVATLLEALSGDSSSRVRFLVAWALEEPAEQSDRVRERLEAFKKGQREEEQQQVELPELTVYLLDKYLKLLAERQERQLLPTLTKKEIKVLLHSFGPSRLELPSMARQGKNHSQEENERYLNRRLANLTLADKVMAHLGIFTVEKVSPVWQDWDWNKSRFGADPTLDPFEMMKVANGLLTGKTTAGDGYYLYCEDYNFGFNLDDELPYQVFCVFHTCFEVVGLVLFNKQSDWEETRDLLELEGDLNLPLFEQILSTSIEEEEKELEATFDRRNQSFAILASHAYAVEDLTEAGNWEEKFKLRKSGAFLSSLKIDHSKLLEFWQWWLKEAVPAAWELAHKNLPL